MIQNIVKLLCNKKQEIDLVLGIDEWLKWIEDKNKSKNNNKRLLAFLPNAISIDLFRILAGKKNSVIETSGNKNSNIMLAKLNLWRYKREIKNAGYRIVQIYMVHPNYIHPHYYLPINRKKNIGKKTKIIHKEIINTSFSATIKEGRSLVFNISAIISKIRIFRYFGRGFLIVGMPVGATNKIENMIDKIHNEVKGLGEAPIILYRGSGTVIVPIDTSSQINGACIKFSFSDQAKIKKDNSIKLLKYIEKKGIYGDLTPKVLCAGKFDNVNYCVESRINGTPGTRIKLSPTKMLSESISVMCRIHNQTKESCLYVKESVWEKRLKILSAYGIDNYVPDIRKLMKLFEVSVKNILISVLSHNDYYLENVLFDKKGIVRGIIDWELADEKGLPVIDILNIILNTNKRYGDGSITTSYKQFINNKIQQHYFMNYCELIEIEPRIDFWIVIYMMYLIWKTAILEIDAYHAMSLSSIKRIHNLAAFGCCFI